MADDKNCISIHKIEPENLSPIVHYTDVVRLEPRITPVWQHRRFVDCQLQWVESGTIRYDFPESGESFISERDSIVFIGPGVLNSQQVVASATETRFACVHFLPRLSPVTVETDPKPKKLTVSVEHEVFRFLFLRLHEMFHARDRYSDAIASGIVREIYLRLLSGREAAFSGPGRLVREMCSFLDENLLLRPGRRELGRRFSLVPEYINQLFHEELGISPGKYVHRELMRKAYCMLSAENIRVKECAARLGFCNAFHFSRLFSEEYGFPPSQVRGFVSLSSSAKTSD